MKRLLRQTGWMILRQLRNLMREPIWIVMMVTQPMLWLLLYGQLFSRVGALRGGASSYVEFLTPGIVAMNAFFGGTWSGMATISDLDRHVIDRFLAAPASRLAIILSQVVRAGITAMMQALILLLVGLALGVRVHGGALGWLVVFAASALLASVFAGFSHGIALLLRREASMIATANMVGLPLMFLSSILVGAALMPGVDQDDRALQPGELGRSGRAKRGRRRWPLGADGRLPAAAARGHRRHERLRDARVQGVSAKHLVEDADHLAGADRLAGGDRELRDRAGAVRVDFVLHLHRLDDAEHLAHVDRVALGDRDRQYRPLHRRDDRVAACAAAAARGRPLLPSSGELPPGWLRLEEPDLEAAAVDLDRAHLVDRTA